MKYKLLTLLLIILLCGIGFGQEKLTKQEKLFLEGHYWSYAILTSATTFYLDGAFKVFESPFAGGIKRVMDEVEPGLYLAPIIRSDGEDVKAEVSVIIHTTVWKKLGIGGGYSFWDESGLKKPQSNNLFFTINITLIE